MARCWASSCHLASTSESKASSRSQRCARAFVCAKSCSSTPSPSSTRDTRAGTSAPTRSVFGAALEASCSARRLTSTSRVAASTRVTSPRTAWPGAKWLARCARTAGSRWQSSTKTRARTSALRCTQSPSALTSCTQHSAALPLRTAALPTLPPASSLHLGRSCTRARAVAVSLACSTEARTESSTRVAASLAAGASLGMTMTAGMFFSRAASAMACA